MTKYYTLYNFANTCVLYSNVTKNIIKNISDDINNYLHRYPHCNVYFLYSGEDLNVKTDHKNFYIRKATKNYELFFLLHMLRHNFFYNNGNFDVMNNTDILQNLYNSIDESVYNNSKHVSIKSFTYTNIICEIKKIIGECELFNNITKTEKIDDMNEYYTNKKLFEDEFNLFCITKPEHHNFNFEIDKFLDSYIITYDTRMPRINTYKNIILENVYYINKRWFNNEKKILNESDIYKDYEYIHHKNKNNKYNQQIFNIDNLYVDETIDEEVLFMDYIYGFYNFGEFWDCVQRLILGKKNINIFGLHNNRVMHIEYYFNSLGYIFPIKYKTTEGNNKLYHFRKVNICTLTESCRGYYDKFIAYVFNCVYNKNNINSIKEYNLYLSRAGNGRIFTQEKEFIKTIKEKHNFTIIDGSENLETIIEFFTYAKVIIGPHGSLQKNIIWCKKNPVIIELCQISRPGDMLGNAINCGFSMFYFKCVTDKNECLSIDAKKYENLLNFVDYIMKKNNCINIEEKIM